MRIPAAMVLGVLFAATSAAQTVDHLTLVAPAAPGGGWDQTARALQQVIDTHDLARIVDVQNVPGAAGTIGLSQFVDAQRGNGRTLLVTGLVMVGATLWNDSPVSVNQATPIARLTGEYEVIAVPASSTLTDMRALIDEFRRRTDAFAWGGGSAGGTDHILAGLVAEAAGVDPRRVNYVAFSGGGEAVAALLGGHVAAGVSGYSEFAAHIASGRLRALAISAPARLRGLDVPTLREAGLDVEMSNWRGLLAPAGISDADRTSLTALVRAAVESDDWRQILSSRGWDDQYLDGEAFAAFLASETTRYRTVVARLRGPATQERVLAGRRIFPVAVALGGALTLVMLIVRTIRARPAGKPASRGQVLSVVLALLTFLLLVRPLGFVAAATALFVVAATAFRRLSQVEGDRKPGNAVVIVALVFCVLVDLAFRRGLDLALPVGTVWSWMR